MCPFSCCTVYGDHTDTKLFTLSHHLLTTHLFPTHTQNITLISRGVRSLGGSKEIHHRFQRTVLNAHCCIWKPRKVGHQNLQGRINRDAWCIIEHIKDRLADLILNLFSSSSRFKNLIFQGQQYASHSYRYALLSILGGDVFAQV